MTGELRIILASSDGTRSGEPDVAETINGSATWQRKSDELAKDFILRVLDEASRPAVIIMRPAQE